MKKLTSQARISLYDNEYMALYNEAYRRSMANGKQCSISSILREYIAPHIAALIDGDAMHDDESHDAVCVPDLDTDNTQGHMPDSDIDSMPDSIHESMREASTTSVASNPGLYDFTDLGN